VKVFKFDPATGRRGEQIDTRKCIDWTSEYLPVDFEPRGFGTDAEVTVHHDAGVGIGEDSYSYRYPDTWICFCSGEWHMGVNDDGTPERRWVWTILPPAPADPRQIDYPHDSDIDTRYT
jgi:hypothetical protein